MQKWVLFAVVAIYVAARLWHLAAVCLDGDEIFSVLLSRLGWKALTAGAAADSVHPPLFYYLLKLWVLIGNESLIWLRLLPALFSVLAILPLILLGRELRLRSIEIHCAIGLAAVHPFLIYYGQHLRMYSLLLLCALTSLWLFQRTIRAGARAAGFTYAALTLANIVLVYSHYYGCVIVGLECLYVLLWRRERWKRTLLSAVAVLAAFTPWLYAAGTRAYAKGGLQSNLNWIAKPTVQDLILFFVEMTGFGDFPKVGRRVGWALVLLIVASIWVQWRRGHTRSLGRALRFLLYFTLCPVAIAFVASLIMPSSVWGRRHLIFVAATLLLLTSVSYWRLRSRAVRLVGALACAAWAIAVISHHLGHDVRKAPFDTFVLQMLDREKETAGPIRLFVLERDLHFAPWFYLKTLGAKKSAGFTVHFTAPELERLSKKAAAFEVRRNSTIDDARGTHFWVLTSTYSWRQKVTPQEIMTQRGCQVGPDLSFSDRYHTITAFPVWCAPAP
jgi:4-amino-4-deoxy-L-arabinose transferase-like glycosyltransferase